MIYIIANTELTRQRSRIDLRGRRQSADGRVMLNEKDLASVMAETYEEKLTLISGEEITESDAIIELNKEVWK
jgi:hypothetical protein